MTTVLARRACPLCGAAGCAAPEHAAWVAAMAGLRASLPSLAALAWAAGPMRVEIPFALGAGQVVSLGTVSLAAPSRPLMLWLYAAMSLHFLSVHGELELRMAPRAEHPVALDDQPMARAIVLDDEVEVRSRAPRYRYPSERATRRRRRPR